MKNILLSFMLMAFCIKGNTQQPIIVSPQWLQEHLKDPGMVVLHTGFVIRADYDREHIEGARFLWPDWLAFNTPEGSMFAPDEKTATKILQDLGINNDSKIVICHKGGDVTIASRMFLSLEHFGLKGRVSFLNGGLEAWKKAGYPVTGQPAKFSKGNYIAHLDPALVDKEYVLKALQSPSSAVVDARMKRWYDGDPTGNPRDGHITGALNIPYPDMVDSTNSIKAADILEKNFTSVVADKKRELVLYCFIGQTACVDYLVARSLGYPVKVYDGSMQEWSRKPELPMEMTRKNP